MQKRSLQKLMTLYLTTGGLYIIVWLQKTRQELMRTTDVRIPSIRWLMGLELLRAVALVSSVLLLIGVANTGRSVGYSEACGREYFLGTVPETAATHSISQHCRTLVERSDAASHRQYIYIEVLIAIALLLLLTWLVYPRWLRNYGLAVQTLTAGRISQTTAMGLLVPAPLIGMLTLQRIFNEISEVQPAAKLLPAESRRLKIVLSTIAVSLAVFLTLFIVFVFLVTHLG